MKIDLGIKEFFPSLWIDLKNYFSNWQNLEFKDKLTIIVALYGAILSTMMLIITILMQQSKLKIDCRVSTLRKNSITVSIKNSGRVLITPDILGYPIKEINKTLELNIINKTLRRSEYIDIFVEGEYLEKLRKNINQIIVIDSLGKKHKVSKRKLRNAVGELDIATTLPIEVIENEQTE